MSAWLRCVSPALIEGVALAATTVRRTSCSSARAWAQPAESYHSRASAPGRPVGALAGTLKRKALQDKKPCKAYVYGSSTCHAK
jgi:hypothetical protein